MNVIVDFLDPPGSIGDGFRVNARIVTWQADKVLKAPARAPAQQESNLPPKCVNSIDRRRLSTARLGRNRGGGCKLRSRGLQREDASAGSQGHPRRQGRCSACGPQSNSTGTQ